MRLGAAHYLPKRAGWVDELPVLVREALGSALLADLPASETCAPPRGRPGTPAAPFIGTTAAIGDVLALVERAAASAVPVLVEGETGTGKELIARLIHRSGPRRERPFLAQNCAAIPEALLETELFGHVRGAFTGADRDRRGLIEEAADGTLFLDEIGEAPPAVQAKLLRVLQHEEVKAIGADRTRPVRARIVAATNRPLDEQARAGRFRPDLYYRLTVFPIRLPPLRHRILDVPALATHFLREAERREGRTSGGLDATAVEALQAYAWPGNVRELENEVHRLVLSVAPGERILPRHLAPRIRDARRRRCDEPLARLLARVETALISQRLRQEPTKSAAARSLGITRETLYAKMRRLRMPPDRA
jgi:transcriptional regulator with PAS, ATPase and Fis domain